MFSGKSILKHKVNYETVTINFYEWPVSHAHVYIIFVWTGDSSELHEQVYNNFDDSFRYYEEDWHDESLSRNESEEEDEEDWYENGDLNDSNSLQKERKTGVKKTVKMGMTQKSHLPN